MANLKARRELLQMFLEKAQENDDRESEASYAALVRQIDEELNAADPEPHRLAREGREAARALSLGRGITSSLIGQDAAKEMYLSLRDRTLAAKTAAERMELLGMMQELEGELPAGMRNEITIFGSRTETLADEAAREGAELARSIQPRREAL